MNLSSCGKEPVVGSCAYVGDVSGTKISAKFIAQLR
jgi:hypothetical protein